MDLSKLPKMSNTPTPPPPQATPETAPQRAATVSASSAADAWISIAIGAIFLFMFPRFLQWLASRTMGTSFNEFLNSDGVVVPYQTLPEFWSDLGPTTFAIVLIIDGLVMGFARRPAMIAIAFGLTVATVVFNLIWLVGSYSSHGFALISALAVAFGGYLASYQWQLMKALRN